MIANNEVTIVGVTGDVRHISVEREAGPQVYLLFDQAPWSNINVLVRSNRDSKALAGEIRNIVKVMDAEVPVGDAMSLSDILADSVLERKVKTFVLGTFALLATMLASVGLYSLVSYRTIESRHEIRVRMAVGADSKDVVLMILGRNLLVVCFGLVAGLAMAFLARGLLTALLYGVGSTDPVVYGAVSAMVLGVCGLATYVPARRAAGAGALVALRND